MKLTADFMGAQERTYTLQQFSPRHLVFENKNAKFPKQISLNRDGVNSYVMVFSNPVSTANASTSLSNKPVVRRMERLRLQ